MKNLTSAVFAAAAALALLSGCVTDDYYDGYGGSYGGAYAGHYPNRGYGYDPYYGYGYGHGGLRFWGGRLAAAPKAVVVAPAVRSAVALKAAARVAHA